MRSESTGRTWRLPTRLLVAAGLALLLAACGKSTTLQPGYPIVTMSATNSGSKFASYIVGIDSITLTEQSGQIVSLAPVSQVVDLVKVSDISELVSAYSVPYGTYKSASILLDYSAASVFVNVNGKAVAAAISATGNTAIGQVNVVVTFDPAKPLVVALQKATPVHMNFELAAFNSINTSSAIPAVTVQPYVVLNPAVIDSTPLRARGSFVTAKDNYFIMNLRPFYNFSASLGAAVVYPTADAYYNINGAVYTGSAGLAAMAGTLQTTVVVAYGTLTGVAGPDSSSATNPTFSAKEIYVGTSQENGLSYVYGMTTARSGTTLTMRGVSLNYYNGTSQFVPGAVVTLDPQMPVALDGTNASGLSVQSISVGQYVYISGAVKLDGSGNFIHDSSGNLEFDATGGTARLLHTRLWGSLVSNSASSATFDLLSLGIFPPSSYNFTGTGPTPADPAAYLVNTGMLDTSGIGSNSLTAIDGATTAFGAAPPDFNATAVTPGSATEQTLVVEWPAGETHPFSSASSNGYVVDLSKSTIGSVYHIYTGPAGINLKAFPASPLITTTGVSQNSLQLSVGSTSLTTGMSVFATPEAYYTGVAAALNGTNKIYHLVAAGHYNGVNNTFVADRISMGLF